MASLNSKFLRAYGIRTDSLGVDPLNDQVVPLLKKIKEFAWHEIRADERGAPDLISLREYGSQDFWWHIMAYNGISLYKDIVEGTSIKIPDYASILTITAYADISSNDKNRVIEI